MINVTALVFADNHGGTEGVVIDGPPPLPAADGPPPLPSTATYYYELNGSKTGPVSKETLSDLFKAGTLNGQNLVWTSGMKKWQTATDHPDISPLLAPGPDTRWSDFMLGTWFSKMTKKIDPGALHIVEGQNTYRSDGTFVSVINESMTIDGREESATGSAQGTWKTEPLDGDRFKMTIIIKKTSNPAAAIDGTPHVYLSLKTGPNSYRDETSNVDVYRRQ